MRNAPFVSVGVAALVVSVLPAGAQRGGQTSAATASAASTR